MNYFIAMQNRRAVADDFNSHTLDRERNEFLIVSRSGGQNEFLSISCAGACSGREVEAPAELEPDAVIHATLVSQGPDGREIFVVERKPRGDADLNGRHLAGDGYFLLHDSDGNVRLTGAVRFRPGAGRRLAGSNPGATTHFDAAYVPWSGERLPAGLGAAWRRRCANLPSLPGGHPGAGVYGEAPGLA